MILDDKYFSMCLCSYINTTKIKLTLIVPVYQGSILPLFIRFVPIETILTVWYVQPLHE